MKFRPEALTHLRVLLIFELVIAINIDLWSQKGATGKRKRTKEVKILQSCIFWDISDVYDLQIIRHWTMNAHFEVCIVMQILSLLQGLCWSFFDTLWYLTANANIRIFSSHSSLLSFHQKNYLPVFLTLKNQFCNRLMPTSAL